MLRAATEASRVERRKRGSFLCNTCGTSNGNRVSVCKSCGTQFREAKRQRVNTTFDCNITPLLDASERKEIDLIYSVRIRPRGPDYRCYVARLTSGEWTCSYGDCQIAEQGRCRSETGKHCTYISAMCVNNTLSFFSSRFHCVCACVCVCEQTLQRPRCTRVPMLRLPLGFAHMLPWLFPSSWFWSLNL